jgi:polar amino acid transport system substrate-binding protein
MPSIALAFVFVLCLVQGTIRAADVIHVADSDYPPFTYLKDGKPSGFSIDLLRLVVARTPGIELRIEYLPFKRAMAISASEPNALITSLSRNEERNKVYQWVGPIYSVVTNLYRLAGRTELQIKDLKESAGRTIGTGAGFKIIDDLVSHGVDRRAIEDISPEHLNIRKLFARRVDYVAFNDWVMPYLLAQEGHAIGDVQVVMQLSTLLPALADGDAAFFAIQKDTCLLYTSPSPRDH